MAKNNFTKSPLNYTGGKHKLLPQLIPLFPKAKNEDSWFIDLFTGGGNVVANVKGYKRLANDFDSKVIGILDMIKCRPVESLIQEIKQIIAEYGLSKTNADGYNKFRDFYNNSENKDSLSLFVLICYSFNHQIRFNSKGEFNMPFGKDRSAYNETIEKNLKAFHEAIQGTVFQSHDFTELKLDRLKEGDFVYCDPPYLITCASYNERDGWNETHERELLNLLDKLHERGIYFGLSNVLSNKGKTNEILQEWCEEHPEYNVHHLNHSYSNCSYHAKDKESVSDEVYITNYKPND